MTDHQTQKIDHLKRALSELTPDERREVLGLPNGGDTDDLKARLTGTARNPSHPEWLRTLAAQSVSAFATLQRQRDEARAECERLREALKPFADAVDRAGNPSSDQHDHYAEDSDFGTAVLVGDFYKARAALADADAESTTSEKGWLKQELASAVQEVSGWSPEMKRANGIEETYTAPDPNVETVRDRLAQRSAKGLETYGVTTAEAGLSQAEWLRHLQDELLDAAVYVQALLADADTVRVPREYVRAAERLRTAAANMACEPWPCATLYLHGSARAGRTVHEGHLKRLFDAEREFSEIPAADREREEGS